MLKKKLYLYLKGQQLAWLYGKRGRWTSFCAYVYFIWWLRRMKQYYEDEMSYPRW